MRAMAAHRLAPMIARLAFVFHFKSVTVKVPAPSSSCSESPSSLPQVANYVLGSNNETRNDLAHYHPSAVPLRLPALYRSYPSVLRLPEIDLFPSPGEGAGRGRREQLVVAFIVPPKQKPAFASDLDTAQAFAHSLQKLYDAEARILTKVSTPLLLSHSTAQGASGYDLSGVDLLVSLFDLLSFSEVPPPSPSSSHPPLQLVNAKPSLLAVAWLRTNYQRSPSTLLLLIPSGGRWRVPSAPTICFCSPPRPMLATSLPPPPSPHWSSRSSVRPAARPSSRTFNSGVPQPVLSLSPLPLPPSLSQSGFSETLPTPGWAPCPPLRGRTSASTTSS
jgi:hypothetical protein